MLLATAFCMIFLFSFSFWWKRLEKIRKCWKRRFQTVNGMGSTHLLVQLYNTYHYFLIHYVFNSLYVTVGLSVDVFCVYSSLSLLVQAPTNIAVFSLYFHTVGPLNTFPWIIFPFDFPCFHEPTYPIIFV